MNNIDFLKAQIEKLQLTFSREQYEKFLKFYEILIEWNQFMNLTAITEFEEVVIKHFADSLAIVKSCPFSFSDQLRILDLGTGAGFPGIPLKIAYPHLQITLLDSLNKRVKFLDEVIDKLGLKHIETVHGRAEELARDKNYREVFDVCVSRAVANLSTLSEYCIPFVKEGGYFISYKSGKIEEEIRNAKKAVKLLGGGLEDVKYFQLLDTDMERSFIIIKKYRKTMEAYPRNAGKPAKEPIM